jgi:hypothetical protein
VAVVAQPKNPRRQVEVKAGFFQIEFWIRAGRPYFSWRCSQVINATTSTNYSTRNDMFPALEIEVGCAQIADRT